MKLDIKTSKQVLDVLVEDLGIKLLCMDSV